MGGPLRGKATEEPPLYHFHRQQVGEQHGGKNQEKERRWRHETEMLPAGVNGSNAASGDHRQRTGCQPWVGAVFEEVPTGAGDEDEQHLRGH